ncbi:MAG: YbaK/EbsC family protein [Patescibacteria group bacterium]
MSISQKVLDFLKKNDIEVKVVGHKKVYTAYDLAQTTKEKLQKIGKTLLVKADGKDYLVLVPGHYYLDISKIKKSLKAKTVELANEKYIKKILNSNPGGLHPFAGIGKIELLLDKKLVSVRDAIIGAGSFTESLRMQAKDLKKLEHVTLGEFGKEAVKRGIIVAKKGAKKVMKNKKVKRAVKKIAKKSPVKIRIKRK